MSKVVTRFAPSPTGYLHVGGARTALFNFLFAKQKGGKFILRIEDTDRERSRPEFEQGIIEGLKWLGISWGEFYRQSERGEVYKKHLERLLQSGAAYWADEAKGRVIRFKNPGQDVIFNDLIRGEVKFNTAELGDFVIAKDLEQPLYHLAVVADDIEMGITHVIRGEDHISNTPRQILIARALGGKDFVYAHIPLLLAPDRSKLSKRHGAVSVLEYNRAGYLPAALINFLVLLGWNPGTSQELFTLEELEQKFALERVQKGAAIFNQEKLVWLNKQYLKKIDPGIILDQLGAALAKKNLPLKPELLPALAPLVLERINKLSDIDASAAAGEWDYFFVEPVYDRALLKSQKHLDRVIELLSPLSETDFKHLKIREAVWDFASAAGRGEVLWPMRVALSGREHSPDPFILAEILGRSEAIRRLKHAALL